MSSTFPICLLAFLSILVPSLTFFHPHGPSIGPFGHSQFLRNVSASARRRFFEIASNQNDTKEAILENLTAWAQSNGVETAFEKANKNCQQKAEQMHGNVSNWLAGDALELFNQLWDIRQNMEITRLAECQQICKLLNSSNPHLELVVPIPWSPIPGPPPPACFYHSNRIEAHFGGNIKPNSRGRKPHQAFETIQAKMALKDADGDGDDGQDGDGQQQNAVVDEDD